MSGEEKKKRKKKVLKIKLNLFFGVHEYACTFHHLESIIQVHQGTKIRVLLEAIEDSFKKNSMNNNIEE